MIFYSFFILILISNYLFVDADNCALLNDCYKCSSSSDGTLPCHWCMSTQTCSNSLNALQCSENMRVTYGYNCPMVPQNEFNYSDEFARNRALPFIGATYAKNPQMLATCIQSNVPNSSLLSTKQVPCDPLNNFCFGYLAYSADDNALILAFRGTVSDSQFALENVNWAGYVQKEFQPVGGKVVAYFHDAFYSLWNYGMRKDLENALRDHPTAEVWVFGHSLGGAIASLTAAWISRMRLVEPERIKFVSFGQPRTGDMIYAMNFDMLVPYKYRIVHHGDGITKIPVRQPLYNTASFTHHHFEVFYPNPMRVNDNFKVCTQAEDPSCSQAWIDPLGEPDIHLNYFNTNLFDWHKMGCPKIY